MKGQTMTLTTPSLADELLEALHLESTGKLDRALAAFVHGLKTDPANMEFLQGLLRTATKKQELEPSTKTTTSAELPPDIQRAGAARNWSELLTLVPAHLAKQPRHVPLLLAAADACEANGLFEQELGYLKQANLAAPDDLEVLRRLGNSHIEFQDYGEALACWRHVAELLPDDDDTMRKVTELTIAFGRQRSGIGYQFNDAATATPRLSQRPRVRQAPATATDNVLGEIRGVHSKLRHVSMQELENAVRESPGNPENYLRLAAIYLEKGRDYDAERLLAKGEAETNHDSRVRHLWEDTRLTRLENKIALARQHLQLQDSPELRAEIDDLCRTRDQVETEIVASRSERDPENAALHYQLGLRLVKTGNVRTACHHFRAALHDFRYAASAAFEMGECLRRAGETREALRAYRLAADSPGDGGQAEKKIAALYHAAELAAQIKLFRLAQRFLAALLQMNSSHRAALALRDAVQRRAQEESQV